MAMMMANEEKRHRRSKVITIEKFGRDSTEYLFWRKQMKRFLRKRDDYDFNDCIDMIRNHLTGKAQHSLSKNVTDAWRVPQINLAPTGRSFRQSEDSSVNSFRTALSTISSWKTENNRQLGCDRFSSQYLLNNWEVLKFDASTRTHRRSSWIHRPSWRQIDCLQYKIGQVHSQRSPKNAKNRSRQKGNIRWSDASGNKSKASANTPKKESSTTKDSTPKESRRASKRAQVHLLQFEMGEMRRKSHYSHATAEWEG